MICGRAVLQLLSFTFLFAIIVCLELSHDFVVIFLLIVFAGEGEFAELLGNCRFRVATLFDEAVGHVLVDWFEWASDFKIDS